MDVHKAYNEVSHAAILRIIRCVGLPERVSSFVKCFHTQRTFAIRVAGHATGSFNADRGVPQGSVLAPVLFNLAMLPLGWPYTPGTGGVAETPCGGGTYPIGHLCLATTPPWTICGYLPILPSSSVRGYNETPVVDMPWSACKQWAFIPRDHRTRIHGSMEATIEHY
ncbi:hypothetical protein HPB49_016853 [Dermacentor silvarum]|uniref:Uncharacterized protein n=1 Tax=Dermacentor silvarum TaxID=543639 RepID=A0ACB8DEG5_DERSI|nr:hypothetical protein HPB49_016853 [Dermacentor silvarum]